MPEQRRRETVRSRPPIPEEPPMHRLRREERIRPRTIPEAARPRRAQGTEHLQIMQEMLRLQITQTCRPL